MVTDSIDESYESQQQKKIIFGVLMTAKIKTDKE